jgi:choline transport protein
MVSAAIIFQQTSCILPQAILLYRGRDKVLPERYFNLGKLGVSINATAVTWVLFLDILYCFPTAMLVTPQNVSYVSVVSVGFMLFVLALWFLTKRGVFKGPRIDFELLHQRRHDAIVSENKVGLIDGQSFERVQEYTRSVDGKTHLT